MYRRPCRFELQAYLRNATASRITIPILPRVGYTARRHSDDAHAACRVLRLRLALLRDLAVPAGEALPRPLTLCRSASMRSMTLDGRSAGSSCSIGLPAALRFTSFL